MTETEIEECLRALHRYGPGSEHPLVQKLDRWKTQICLADDYKSNDRLTRALKKRAQRSALRQVKGSPTIKEMSLPADLEIVDNKIAARKLTSDPEKLEFAYLDLVAESRREPQRLERRKGRRIKPVFVPPEQGFTRAEVNRRAREKFGLQGSSPNETQQMRQARERQLRRAWEEIEDTTPKKSGLWKVSQRKHPGRPKLEPGYAS